MAAGVGAVSAFWGTIIGLLIGLAIGWLLWRWRKRSVAASEWASSQLRMESLTKRAAEAEASRIVVVNRLSTAEVDKAALTSESAGLRAERNAARSRVEEVGGELEAMRSSLSASVQERDQIRDRLEFVEADLANANTDRLELDEQVVELRRELTARDKTIDSVGVAAASADGRVAELEADLQAGAERVSSLVIERDSATDRASALVVDRDAANERAARAADDTADRIRLLEQTVAGLRSEVADGCGHDDELAELAELRTATAAPSWVVGTTSIGTPGAAHRDDLKVINGIGPKLEHILNELGVTSWEQVAIFSSDEVERVSDALNTFSGRIERDEWVRQAGDLVSRFPLNTKRPTRETFLNDSLDTTPFEGPH